MNSQRRRLADGMVTAIFIAGVQFSTPALGGSGLVAVGIHASGELAVSSDSSSIQVDSTPGFVPVEAGNDYEELLAVGPGWVHSGADGSWIFVLDRAIEIDEATRFPRGFVTDGDYIAVSGSMDADGSAIAGNVVRLGGQYVPSTTPVYIRGIIERIDATGAAAISGASVNLANSPAISSLVPGTVVEILGVATASAGLLAYDTSVIGSLTGSGARGITGSGARGITGSGARGITGSGARGITGSGARGITGSGARGITGSGARGITGSGARGITGSGARGITGSGARGITGSGARGITGSGARGITGSGARGITGSGARGITGSGARGITGSGARGITGSGARGITGSGARGITGSGARGITGSGARGITGSGARGSTGSDES